MINASQIIEQTKAQKALPVISIVASLAGITLIIISLHSLRLQIRHTNMQLDRLEKEEAERNAKLGQ